MSRTNEQKRSDVCYYIIHISQILLKEAHSINEPTLTYIIEMLRDEAKGLIDGTQAATLVEESTDAP